MACVCCSQTWYTQEDAKQEVNTTADVPPAVSVPDLQARLLVLCKKGKAKGKQRGGPWLGMGIIWGPSSNPSHQYVK